MKRIYLDSAAATPLDKRVEAAMRPWLSKNFGNPSSVHAEGLAAARAVGEARKQIAGLLGAQPDEIIFTSGGTEANNLAILGGASKGGLITTKIEHPSILRPAEATAKAGFPVIYLPVDQFGLVSPKDLAAALGRLPTAEVSIIYLQNEIGTIQPIGPLAKVIRDFKKAKSSAPPANRRPIFHLDACQAPRFLDCSATKLGVDLLSLNSGKIYGPKGVGCLYRRRGLSLAPRQLGGGQERDLRSGTENVAGIVGFAAALAICAAQRADESERLAKLRDRLIVGLTSLPGARLNGHPRQRSPNNVNISFAGVEAEQMVIELDARGIAVSAGSACASPAGDESYVIMALGRNRIEAQSAVRFTLGREISGRQIVEVIKAVAAIIHKYHYARNTIAKL